MYIIMLFVLYSNKFFTVFNDSWRPHGRGFVISPVFLDSFVYFYIIDLLFIFCGWGVGEGGSVTELVIFCGCRKCMTPNHKQ